MALMGSSFGNGFHGRPAGGHLPKPLHELLLYSSKLVPCQLQLTTKHSLTRHEFTCLASPGNLVKKTLVKYKMLVPKFSPFYFLHHILIKINKICSIFWFFILVSKTSAQRIIERQINVKKCWFSNQVPSIERTIFLSNIDQFWKFMTFFGHTKMTNVLWKR